MRAHNKNRHRSVPRVEALEGITLLSTGLMGQHTALHARSALSGPQCGLAVQRDNDGDLQ